MMTDEFDSLPWGEKMACVTCPDCGSTKTEYLGQTAIEDGETVLVEPHFRCLDCGCDFTPPDELD